MQRERKKPANVSATRAVLGIDAAWTSRNPSGVALVVETSGVWKCAAVAPSYSAFIALAEDTAVEWRQAIFPGSVPDIPRLLRAAARFTDAPIEVVAVDMPIATVAVHSRRMADRAISQMFGSRWCSTHSPSVSRPGQVGKQLSQQFIDAGFSLATTSTCPPGRLLMEVYPHVALLALLKRECRVPYKASKTRSYWPDLDTAGRFGELLRELEAICDALKAEFGLLSFDLPRRQNVTSFSMLKRYEDVIDALICAWVGVEFLRGRATPLGDVTAAIWCPSGLILGNAAQG